MRSPLLVEPVVVRTPQMPIEEEYVTAIMEPVKS